MGIRPQNKGVSDGCDLFRNQGHSSEMEGISQKMELGCAIENYCNKDHFKNYVDFGGFAKLCFKCYSFQLCKIKHLCNNRSHDPTTV